MENENENRILIMNILRNYGSLTISEIVKKTKLSRPTIYLHLDNLEKKRLISRKKDNKKKGAPVTISIIKDSVDKKDKEDLLKFLNEIKKNGFLTTDYIVEKNFDINGSSSSATLNGFIEKRTYLTKEGLNFLNDNKK